MANQQFQIKAFAESGSSPFKNTRFNSNSGMTEINPATDHRHIYQKLADVILQRTKIN